MEMLHRIIDANAFLLAVPRTREEEVVLATLHPFYLDGRGYEARIYRANHCDVEISATLGDRGAGGWGVDEIACERRVVTLANGDILPEDDIRLRISIATPYLVQWKQQWLTTHPILLEDGPPADILRLFEDNAVPWKTFTFPQCYVEY